MLRVSRTTGFSAKSCFLSTLGDMRPPVRFLSKSGTTTRTYGAALGWISVLHGGRVESISGGSALKNQNG